MQPANLSRHDRALPQSPSRAPFHTWPSLFRHTAAAGMAGVAAGLAVGGVLGRLFMRIAGAAADDLVQGATTEAGFRVGEITLGGTLALVVFIGVFSGIAGSVSYLVFRPWLAWAGRWRGLGFGVVLFATTSATSDMLNPDNPDFIILRNEALLVGLIVAMFLGFGVLTDLLFTVLDRRLPAPEPRFDPARFLYAGLTGLGLLLAAPVPMMLFSTATCSCRPPLLASVFVVVTAVATLSWWLTGLVARYPAWLTPPTRVLGYAGLTGAVTFGLFRALSDAAQIVF